MRTLGFAGREEGGIGEEGGNRRGMGRRGGGSESGRIHGRLLFVTTGR